MHFSPSAYCRLQTKLRTSALSQDMFVFKHGIIFEAFFHTGGQLCDCCTILAGCDRIFVDKGQTDNKITVITFLCSLNFLALHFHNHYFRRDRSICNLTGSKTRRSIVNRNRTSSTNNNIKTADDGGRGSIIHHNW